jgi:DNA-binding transcriptional ArsR family regulator
VRCVGPTLSKRDLTRLAEDLKFTPELDELAARLDLLGNGTRLKIFWLLAEVKELCVCDIAGILGVTVSAISQHLSKFKAYGMVKPRRDASTIYYSLSTHPFNEAAKQSLLKGVEV